MTDVFLITFWVFLISLPSLISEPCHECEGYFEISKALEGQPVFMDCMFCDRSHDNDIGYNFTWYKNGTRIWTSTERHSRVHQDGKMMKFFPARLEDSGFYDCIAGNSTNCNKKSIQLVVYKNADGLCYNKEHIYPQTLRAPVDKLVCKGLSLFTDKYHAKIRWYKVISDGKAYDGYVIYPKSSKPVTAHVQTFVLKMLPEVLEKQCGYKLFIFGRDELAGEAAASLIEETIKQSRRLIITLTNKESKDDLFEDAFERQVALYNALIHNKDKVILIELEKIADYVDMPESIKYIKQKQGILRWKGDSTDCGLSPNTKFWKNGFKAKVFSLQNAIERTLKYSGIGLLTEYCLQSKRMGMQRLLAVHQTGIYLFALILDLVDCRIMKAPRIIYPQNNTFLEVEPASKVNISCKAFIGYNVSFEDAQLIPIYWLINKAFTEKYPDIEEVHSKALPSGEVTYVESFLVINKVTKAFYNASFTCVVSSASGMDFSFLYLIQPKHPGMPVWQHVVLGIVILTCLVLLAICIYIFFKIDIILFYHTSCKRKTKEDGKVYDAYVIYPKNKTPESPCIVETFALEILPAVLERQCGYSLFILGRDELPGEAIADVVEDFIEKSRTLIIILTSIFCDDGQEQTLFEQHIGLHNALIHNKMKVILIELETAVDYTNMPESIKYIKHKQGAIRWKGDFTERSLSPNTKFWKNVRCQMSKHCFQETCKYDLEPIV
ncbi:interleukin-1 receptor type 1-like [Rhinatrema bivittatum]|uniref:interleukin-1 receptor type 1-like n=1 Tax=Rhinatrema bivittatum TaxID=194408 RepID=UPI00112AE492|nr:interleukin-1 receptor type 1-like [Rhinatrema bivittatum]